MFIKKITVFVLALFLCISCLLSGCDSLLKEDTNQDDVYISLAQGFLDKGDNDSAIEILEEGFEITGSKEIETLLTALRAVQAQTDAATLPPETQPAQTQPANTEPAMIQPTPITPSTVPPAQTPTQAPSANLLSSKNQKKVNIFLSNFAEQGFEKYPADDHAMLNFGYIFCKYNKQEYLYSAGEYYCVDKKHMDTVLKDYFGKTVSPSDSFTVFYGKYNNDIITYDAGTYSFEMADGEFSEYVAIANYMESNGDGTYTVDFDIYAAYEGLENSYYSLTASEAENSSKLEWHTSGLAVIQEHTRSTGVESYILLKYTVA